MKRRTLLKTTALAAVSPLAWGVFNSRRVQASPLHNEDFYTDGKFDEDKAKDGVVALCKRFGYPVFPELHKNLWV